MTGKCLGLPTIGYDPVHARRKLEPATPIIIIIILIIIIIIIVIIIVIIIIIIIIIITNPFIDNKANYKILFTINFT